MKFLITGDLVVNEKYNALENIDKTLIDLFSNSDINIVNLEAPVTDCEYKILKTGPNIKSHKESTAAILKTLNVDIVTLANNHVLDYGEQGVKDTLAFCEEQEVKTVGAGMNLSEASSIFYIDTKEGKIAVVNFAENEWASANQSSAGANPMDLIDNTIQIKEAKNQADFVLVIVHGGHEYYNLPSPRMQKLYRFYAEQGADIIIGHHTHCLSGYEVYNNVPIFYSLGNFLFTNNSSYDDWYLGGVLEIIIEKGNLLTKLHYVFQEKSKFQLRLLTGKKKKHTEELINNFNSIIKNKEQLETNWEEYSKKQRNMYFNYWAPLSFVKNRYLRFLFRKTGVNFINKHGLALYLNLMRCESHRDLSEKIITNYLKNENSHTS